MRMAFKAYGGKIGKMGCETSFTKGVIYVLFLKTE